MFVSVAKQSRPSAHGDPPTPTASPPQLALAAISVTQVQSAKALALGQAAFMVVTQELVDTHGRGALPAPPTPQLFAFVMRAWHVHDAVAAPGGHAMFVSVAKQSRPSAHGDPPTPTAFPPQLALATISVTQVQSAKALALGQAAFMVVTQELVDTHGRGALPAPPAPQLF